MERRKIILKSCEMACKERRETTRRRRRKGLIIKTSMK
jgi:hypothetical protein